MGCSLNIQGAVDNVEAYENNGFRVSSNSVQINGKEIYTGMKFQCVEYARRYLLVTQGVTFQDVGRAHQIYDIEFVTNVHTNDKIPFKSFPQGGNTPPQKGDLVIYQKSGNQWWGHVAVVASVADGHVALGEQNYDRRWENMDFSRKVQLDKVGDNYFIRNIRHDGRQFWDMNEVIIGWKRSSS